MSLFLLLSLFGFSLVIWDVFYFCSLQNMQTRIVIESKNSIDIFLCFAFLHICHHYQRIFVPRISDFFLFAQLERCSISHMRCHLPGSSLWTAHDHSIIDSLTLLANVQSFLVIHDNYEMLVIPSIVLLVWISWESVIRRIPDLFVCLVLRVAILKPLLSTKSLTIALPL